MLRRFASLYDPSNHAFSYDSEAWNSNAEVNAHFRMYQTYNDGLTQHSTDWAITKEHLLDYLASISVYMLAHPEDEEMVQHMSMIMARRPDVKEIAFAHSVVWKESDDDWKKPRRYFSRQLLKITSSRGAEHDKRYEEIKKCQDGSPLAMFQMLIPEYAQALQLYAYVDAIRDWTLECKDDGMYMGLPATFLEWPEYKDSDRARNLRYAYNACRSICESYRQRCSAQCDIGNLHVPVQEKTEEVA